MLKLCFNHPGNLSAEARIRSSRACCGAKARLLLPRIADVGHRLDNCKRLGTDEMYSFVVACRVALCFGNAGLCTHASVDQGEVPQATAGLELWFVAKLGSYKGGVLF